MVDLLFTERLDTSHPVHLTFGEGAGGDPPGDTSVQFNLTIPVSAAFDLQDRVEPVTFSIAIPPPWLSMVLAFDNAVPRGLRSSAGSRWQVATPKLKKAQLPFQQATRSPAVRRMPWTKGTSLHVDAVVPWQEMDQSIRVGRRTVWQEGTHRHGTPTRDRWQEMDRRKRPQLAAPWQEATPVRPQAVQTFWQETTRTSRATHTARWGEGTHRSALVQTLFGAAKARHADLRAPWQEGRYPPPGRTIVVPPTEPPEDPCYIPPPGLAVPIVFDLPWDGSPNLLFICPGVDGPPATVVVPIRRVYMIVNEATLIRVDGAVMIPTYRMSMSLDVDSWTWSFSASVPGVALSSVEPDSSGAPVEVEATVNGVPYRFLIESIQRERVFGSSNLSISGRGKSALLDNPYAPSLNFRNTTDRTAQQLMADVLTDNGVPLGWDVDWNLTDWLVPADVFSHSGSYISALNSIAAAAGAYIQPHNTAQELRVNLRYPTAPWEWAGVTPDFELPSAVTTRESIEWVEKARYNRVWVSGQQNGVLARVTRTGTDGGLLAPLITDPLITQSAAARQRGVSVLADTGRVATVGLRLPVLDATGIIPPGRMVRYTDGGVVRLGITRSVSVDVAMPEIWQSIAVETHQS